MYNRLIALLLLTALFYSCNKLNSNKNQGKQAGTISDTSCFVRKAIPDVEKTDLRDFLVQSFFEYRIDENIKNKIPVNMLLKSDYTDYKSFALTKKTTINYGDITGIYPKMNIYLFTYDNTNQCNGIFSNWLTTIGDSEEVKINNDLKYVKTAPVYSIRSERFILVLYYLCEHAENDWELIKQKLNTLFQNREKLIMNIECGGPLTWKSEN